MDGCVRVTLLTGRSGCDTLRGSGVGSGVKMPQTVDSKGLTESGSPRGCPGNALIVLEQCTGNAPVNSVDSMGKVKEQIMENDKQREADIINAVVNEEYIHLDKQNEKMRAEGLPVISTSIDATVGASVTTFKEFQLAEIAEISKMTLPEIQQRIRQFKFEQWALAQKMMTDFSYLNDMASKLSKEARADLKLTDIAYNPKELAEPKKMKGGMTAQEKQIKDLQKLMPNMSEAEIQEMIRKGKGDAFQKGLYNGSPAKIDTCAECGHDYNVANGHDCPVKAAKLAVANTVKASEGETLTERLARLRGEK